MRQIKIIVVVFIWIIMSINLNAQVTNLSPGSEGGELIYPTSLTLTFQWTNSGGYDHRIHIVEHDGGANDFDWTQSDGFLNIDEVNDINENVGTSTTFSHTVTPGKSYAWSVKDANSLLFSNRFYFVVAAEAPSLVSPSNNATVSSQVNFQWNSIPDGTSYRLQVSSSNNFDNINGFNNADAYDQNVENVTSKTLNLASGTYYWSVKGATDVSASWYADIRSFTIENTGSYNLQLSGNISITPDPLQHGELASFHATVENTGDEDFTGTIYMSWHYEDGTYITDLDTKNNLSQGTSHTLNFDTDQISYPGGNYKVIIKYTEDYSTYISLGEKNITVENTTTTNPDKKIIGYLPGYKWWSINDISYNLLTHLNIAFVNPSSSFEPEMSDDITSAQITELIQTAKSINPNIQIFISIGGYAACLQGSTYYNNYQTIFANQTNRQTFINNLFNFVNLYNLDGIDIDIEWKALELSGFNEFVGELSVKLHDNDKLVSIATEDGTWGNLISDASLNNVDWINSMAYNNAGENASYSFFIENYNYCFSTRNINKDKIVMGLPFYGKANGEHYSFCEIIAPYSNPTTIEQYELTDHPSILGTIYWNGPSAIQEKCIYSKNNANGVMIWELSQAICSFNSTSLLQIIYNEIFGTNNIQNSITKKVNIYPNPAKEYIIIDNVMDVSFIQMFSVTGQVILEKKYNSAENQIMLNTELLNNGIYIIKINTAKESFVKQVIINK